MNPVEKGNKVEKEACKIAFYPFDEVERIKNVETPTKNSNDLFSYADLIVMNQGEPTRLVQVKTSNIQNKGHYIKKATMDLQSKHLQCEIWVKEENGWSFHNFDDYERKFVKYFKTSSINPNTVGENYLENVQTENINPRNLTKKERLKLKEKEVKQAYNEAKNF